MGRPSRSVSTSAVLQPHEPTADLGAKALFAALLIVPTVLGFVPALLFLNRPFWILIAAAVALGVAIIYLAYRGSAQSRPVTPAEALAAGIGGLAISSSMGLAIILWYWIVYLIVYLFAKLFGVIASLVPVLSDFVPSGWDGDGLRLFAVIVLNAVFVPA